MTDTMLRSSRKRQGFHGEGPGGRRCRCCKAYAPNRAYRSREKAETRRLICEEVAS